jgi:hypothetical protein
MKVRLLLALAPILLAAPSLQQHAPPKDLEGGSVEVDHFIFFAVLEGLFADGVGNDLATKVLERDEKIPGGHANFVYACPICRPTIEAFRAHLARREFEYGRKGDMIGPSKVPAEISKALLEGSAEDRRAALQKLITKYIQARMDLLRLTAEERGIWNAVLENRRAMGTQTLKTLKLPWKGCPSCEGAFTGSRK